MSLSLVVSEASASLHSFEGLDVEGVIVRQTGKLDWPYIQRHLAPLAELKGQPEILVELEKRRVEFER